MNTDEQSANPDPNQRPLNEAAGQATASPRKRLILLAVVATLLLVASGAGYGAHRRVQTNPEFCFGACHTDVDRASMPPQGVHKDTRCANCHDLRFWQSAKQWLSGPKTGVPHGVVAQELCGSCHVDSTTSKKQVGMTVGHDAHNKAGVGCPKCHGASKSHDIEPKPAVCKDCHPKSTVYEKGMADLPCLACHNFLARGSKIAKAPATDCRACHGGPNAPHDISRFATVKKARDVSTSMIHGNIFACSLCHQPHKEKVEDRRSGRECARCHSRAPQSAASISNPAHSACGTCHKVHSLRSELASACARCHQLARSQDIQGTTAGKHPSCSSCHTAHEFKASRSECGQCHVDQSPLAKIERLKPHAECGNCHSPHQPAAEQQACMKCHAEKKGHGHPQCTTCHDPHKEKSSTKQCVNCHGDQATALAASGKGGHNGGCPTCHTLHAPSGASSRCSSCHPQQAGPVAAAGIAPHTNCASCHHPHTFSAATAMGACAGCHKINTSGAHRGECRTCHTPHGSPRIGADACGKCHANIPKAQGGKHQECRSCHQPHQAATKGGAMCTTCHAAQQAAANAYPAAQHKACPGCHQQHNWSQKTPCASCHGKESASASGGKHQCSSCHSPHQAPGDWWARCSKCHGGQSAAAKSRGATHGNCQSCHKPHKFSKPTCQACHNAMGRMGAHGNAGHASCASCHDTHARSSPTRNTCLGCHKDKTTHNANAKSCTGCHLFN